MNHIKLKNYRKKNAKKTLKKTLKKTSKSTKKMYLRKSKKTRNNKIKGGNPISQLSNSIIGTAQYVYDGWNGKPSSFTNVYTSPETQIPLKSNQNYKSTHYLI